MSITNVLNAGIYSLLSGGTGLAALVGSAIYYQVAPDGAVPPYAVWSYQGGGPLNITKSDLRDSLVYARGYAKSQALAGSIDAQLAGLLHKGTISAAGYNNVSTLRETDINLVEITKAGERVFAAGGVYRVRLDD